MREKQYILNELINVENATNGIYLLLQEDPENMSLNYAYKSLGRRHAELTEQYQVETGQICKLKKLDVNDQPPLDVTIRISKKDKNLVSLLVLAEFVCKSIVTITDKKYKDFAYKKIPKDKDLFYQHIMTMFSETTKKCEILNEGINDAFLRIYGSKEMNTMMDSIIGVLDLLESQDPKRVNQILKDAGFKGSEAFFEKSTGGNNE